MTLLTNHFFLSSQILAHVSAYWTTPLRSLKDILDLKFKTKKDWKLSFGWTYLGICHGLSKYWFPNLNFGFSNRQVLTWARNASHTKKLETQKRGWSGFICREMQCYVIWGILLVQGLALQTVVGMWSLLMLRPRNITFKKWAANVSWDKGMRLRNEGRKIYATLPPYFHARKNLLFLISLIQLNSSQSLPSVRLWFKHWGCISKETNKNLCSHWSNILIEVGRKQMQHAAWRKYCGGRTAGPRDRGCRGHCHFKLGCDHRLKWEGDHWINSQRRELCGHLA